MGDQQPCVNTDISLRPCPRCNSQISYLRMYAHTENLYAPSVEAVRGERQIAWEMTGTMDCDEALLDFECPVCSETLFTDQEVAEQWLLNPTSVKMPMFTGKFHTILGMTRTDIAVNFDGRPHLAEAVAFLQDFEIQRLLSKVTDAIVDGDNLRAAIEVWFEDELEDAYKKNKKAILDRIKADLEVCPICDTEPASIEETKHLREYGLCETCKMEDSEKEGVENAIRKTSSEAGNNKAIHIQGRH